MIGLGSGSGLDFDSRTSQNLIDFPSHTISSVNTGKGKSFYPQTLRGEKKIFIKF